MLLVELPSCRSQDREHVLPLALGDLASLPIPFQLPQHGVLGALDENGARPLGIDRLLNGSPLLLGVEWTKALDEEVDLERGRLVNGVESASVGKGLTHRR